MCDVPSIAVFCSESIECFPGTAYKFFFKLLVTIPVAPIITGIMYCSFANIELADMLCSTVSSDIFYRVCICYLFLSVIFMLHDIRFKMPYYYY